MNIYQVLVDIWVSGKLVTGVLSIQANNPDDALDIASSYPQIESVECFTDE